VQAFAKRAGEQAFRSSGRSEQEHVLSGKHGEERKANMGLSLDEAFVERRQQAIDFAPNELEFHARLSCMPLRY
jgi:hypothetical protein